MSDIFLVNASTKEELLVETELKNELFSPTFSSKMEDIAASEPPKPSDNQFDSNTLSNSPNVPSIPLIFPNYAGQDLTAVKEFLVLPAFRSAPFFYLQVPKEDEEDAGRLFISDGKGSSEVGAKFLRFHHVTFSNQWINAEELGEASGETSTFETARDFYVESTGDGDSPTVNKHMEQVQSIPVAIPNWTLERNTSTATRNISVYSSSITQPYFYLHLPPSPPAPDSTKLSLTLSLERKDPCLATNRLTFSNAWQLPNTRKSSFRARSVTSPRRMIRSKSIGSVDRSEPVATKRTSSRNVLPRVIVTGSDGVGKSSVLNALIGSVKFKTGVSPTGAVTRNVTCVEHDNICFIDTPSLPFPKNRSLELNIQMTKAMSEAPSLRIVHVAALESGRLRTSDIIALRAIVSALRGSGVDDREVYSLVLNKASKAERNLALRDNAKELEVGLLGKFRDVGSIDKNNVAFLLLDYEKNDDEVIKDAQSVKDMVASAPVISTDGKVIEFERVDTN